VVGALEMDDAAIGGADRPLLPSVSFDLLLASHSAATLSAIFLPGASVASNSERSRRAELLRSLIAGWATEGPSQGGARSHSWPAAGSFDFGRRGGAAGERESAFRRFLELFAQARGALEVEAPLVAALVRETARLQARLQG